MLKLAIDPLSRLKQELSECQKLYQNDQIFLHEAHQKNQITIILTIIGPKSTPWADGKYEIAIKFSNGYMTAPVISFNTRIYHPLVIQDNGDTHGQCLCIHHPYYADWTS